MPIRQERTLKPVNSDLMTAFDRTVSPDRWRTYQFASGFKDDLAMQLYLWNASLGQSFHFPLQAVEVALRNVVQQALADEYGPEWAFEAGCRAVLHVKQITAITKAANRHRNKYGNDPATSNIVASVTFGFWTQMLRREYDRAIWDKHTGTAFPHLPDQETPNTVFSCASRVQDLRNRVFHQEPLIGHNLLGDYGEIIKLLSWICPYTKNWVKKNTSVPNIIRQRPALAEGAGEGAAPAS